MRKQRDRKQGCCKSIRSFFQNIGRTPNPIIHEKYIDAAPINVVKKLLLLDLDGTLIQSTSKEITSTSFKIERNENNVRKTYYISIRDGALEFIQKMSNFYEVGIFTTSPVEIADPLIEQLDVNKKIKMKYYRHHCVDGHRIKDLNALHLDMSQVILIDNSTTTFSRQPQNGLLISTYNIHKPNRDLVKMMPILERMSHLDDVRPVQQNFLEMKVMQKNQKDLNRSQISQSSQQHSQEKSQNQNNLNNSRGERGSIQDLKSFERKSVDRSIGMPEKLSLNGKCFDAQSIDKKSSGGSPQFSPSNRLALSHMRTPPDSAARSKPKKSNTTRLKPYKGIILQKQISDNKITSHSNVIEKRKQVNI